MRDARSSFALSFSERVTAWQNTSGRHDLPWQQSGDAYRVWLSEVMLQQTQVRSVIPYFARFLERFPTLEVLAAAPLESVLEQWSGLGYYARARNLHRCAQTLVRERGGGFSAEPADNAELPGIGRSTAAAISVFAFGRRAAILDGNVKRVLARCFGVAGSDSPARDERVLWDLAESLLPENDIETYTQGMMDLGATVCSRRKPCCDTCPLQEICVARHEGRQAELPTRPTPRALPQRFSRVLLVCDGRRVLLERRPPSGIWGGLLSLPEMSGESAERFAENQGCRLLDTQSLPPVTHAFTHFRLTIDVLRCEVEIVGLRAMEVRWQWLPLENVAAAALPMPIKKLLRSLPLKG
jgi:A/G-specific adenine glycosylase